MRKIKLQHPGLPTQNHIDPKITTVGVKYLNSATDKDLGLVQTSHDERLIVEELFLVSSGNFKFGFNVDKKNQM